MFRIELEYKQNDYKPGFFEEYNWADVETDEPVLCPDMDMLWGDVTTFSHATLIISAIKDFDTNYTIELVLEEFDKKDYWIDFSLRFNDKYLYLESVFETYEYIHDLFKQLEPHKTYYVTLLNNHNEPVPVNIEVFNQNDSI